MGLLDETASSLARVQQFAAESLVQDARLGKDKAFTAAVGPAQRLIDLYARLSERALQDFPDATLNEIKQRANADFKLFDEILKFDTNRSTAERDGMTTALTEAYNAAFALLHPLVAYSLHRSADFRRLETEARAVMQEVSDRAVSIETELNETKAAAQSILSDVRKTAAESGVTQQAMYFKEAADEHEAQGEVWRTRLINLAWAAGAFAFASLFFHKIPWLRPTSAYETVQIGVSKILIFGVLSFLLYLAARNFMSHRHNAVVNRHRHQSLLTFRALVAAAGVEANRDIVLTHAAACIFGPQSTGYSDDGRQGAPSAKSVVELMGSNIARGAASA